MRRVVPLILLLSMLWASQAMGAATPPGGSCPNATYGYQGYGSTTGGEGQTIVTVTNNQNSGTGSLRDAVGSNRCVQFSSAMTITLNSSLILTGFSNLTIDGLSAPSPGITLAHCGIYAQGPDANHIILRGLRIRMDSSSEGNCGTEGDGIGMLGPIGQGGPHHWIIDRNSVAGAVDENLGLAYYVGYAAHDLTISRNFFTDPTQVGPNRVNTMIAAGLQRVSFHHNLMADGTRLPRVAYDDAGSVSPDVMADVRNNISWMNDEGSTYAVGAKANAINNYFIKAASMGQVTFEQRAINLENPGTTQLYTSGNDANPFISNLNGRGNVGSPFTAGVPSVTTTSALQGACDVVNQAGVFPRDSHDQDVLSRFTLTGCVIGPEPPPTPGLIAWYKANGNANDSQGTNHGTLASGATASGAPLVEGNSFSLDGIDDWVFVPNTPTLQPAAIGISLWMKSTTLPTGGRNCNVVSEGLSWIFGWDPAGHPFCQINFAATATDVTKNVVNGQPHMLSCGYDPTESTPGVRLWLENAPVAFASYSAPISYSGWEVIIGNNTDGQSPCGGLVDQVRIANFAWKQDDIDAMFLEQVPVDGTSMTQSQWERANKAIGDVIATNADLPAHDRTQAIALAVAIQRVGTSITQYFALECAKNGGAFTTLTNLFGTLGARIAPDSVLNMGDSVPVTPALLTGGFTGVAGRVVANTINTSFTTTLATAQQTQWRYTLDFGGPALSGDVFQCRPVGLDSYANVKTITLADPSVFLGIKGSTMKGLRLQ